MQNEVNEIFYYLEVFETKILKADVSAETSSFLNYIAGFTMKKFPANVMVAFCDRLSNALKSEKSVLQVSR